MLELYKQIEKWQKIRMKNLTSISIQQEGGYFCCIALYDPKSDAIVSF